MDIHCQSTLQLRRIAIQTLLNRYSQLYHLNPSRKMHQLTNKNVYDRPDLKMNYYVL